MPESQRSLRQQNTSALEATEADLADAVWLLRRARLCMDNVHRDGISAGFVKTREDVAAFLGQPNAAEMFVSTEDALRALIDAVDHDEPDPVRVSEAVDAACAALGVERDV